MDTNSFSTTSNLQPRTYQPLVVIVGPTASGKTSLAVEVAKKYNGEVICADSRTVYKRLDIGTAKPTVLEQRTVPHYLLDIVNPDQVFTAARFKALATSFINDIRQRAKMPILVGGSGLYINSVIYDYDFQPPADPELRKQYNVMSISKLQEKLSQKGIDLPTNQQNPRHLIRALETEGKQSQNTHLIRNVIIIGLCPSKEALHTQIEQRVEQMFKAGLIEEAAAVAKQYGWNAPGLQATSYKAVKGYIEGTESLEVARQKFIQNDKLLAKRQLTWFRRNKSIHWLAFEVSYVDSVTTLLNTQK